MKLLRQVIFILATLSAFIYLTIFSAIEYGGKENDFSVTDDRLPIAREMVKGVSNVVSIMEKMPLLRLIPTDLEKVSFHKNIPEEFYGGDKMLLESENESNLSNKYLDDFPYREWLENLKRNTWSDFLRGLKDKLFGNWFSS